MICLVMASGLALTFPATAAPEPSPASWIRTLIMSMGWMMVVAAMPERPPLMKGRKVLVKRWCLMLSTIEGGWSWSIWLIAGAMMELHKENRDSARR